MKKGRAEMGHKTLVTLRGTRGYDEERYAFTALDNGALQILDTDEGTTDLIGPGFWVAVLDEVPDGQRRRLDWDFLAPPEPPQD